jgi:hypothetical protein
MYNLSGIAYGEVYAIQIYVILVATGQSCSPGTCTCILVSFTQTTCLHDTTALRSLDCLAQNQNNVSMWSDMSTHGLFQSASTIKIQLSVLV